LAKSYIYNDTINVLTVNKLKMKDAKAVGKMVIIGVLIVVIVVAGVIGYYLTVPQSKLKETLIMGTTDSVESCLDPARAYDYFGL
jgi:peptide/nickel transport system substrate-binding protein